MMKDNRRKEIAFSKDLGLLSIIGSPGYSRCAGNENGGDSQTFKLCHKSLSLCL